VIKIVFCLRRLPSLSPEQFHDHWKNQHAPLVRACAPALNIVRYVQSRGVFDPRLQGAIDVRGPRDAPYDGIAEVWWESLDAALAAGSTPEGRAAGRRLLEDERRFIDLANSPIMYADETVVVGG